MGRRTLASPLGACLAASLLALGALSAREEGGTWELGTGAAGPEAGKGCVALENFDREKLLTTTPPEVYLTLERRGLSKEYRALVDTLYSAERGTMGAWKCSALSRAIYIRGHDEAFAAKDVAVYLTRAGQAVGSAISLCLVDRTKEPTYTPPDVYSDGTALKFAPGKVCAKMPSKCDGLGKLPAGVYGQVYDGRGVRAGKMDLPVALLKFLVRKDLLVENMDMAALVDTGDRTGFSAAQVVADFKERFRKKGAGLFFAQARMAGYGIVVEGELEVEWHQWFEYADLDVVGGDYKPTLGDQAVEYPQAYLDVYNECQAGDPSRLVVAVAHFHRQKANAGGCGDVAGATGRRGTPFPKCKCKNEGEKVFCGDTFVADRKFDSSSVLSLSACSSGQVAYCGTAACLPPSERP